MRRSLLLVAGLVAIAPGQWSEPVVLGDSCSSWAAGPVLVPAGRDTIWAVWKRHSWDYRSLIVARRFAGDSWSAVERLTPDSSCFNYPAGILDDSGRVLVAYYHGSYPVSGLSEQDSWGIFTVTRTDTGWTRPQLVHEMMIGERLPFDIRLGCDQRGGIGMVWEEGSGGIHHTGSVMLSRRTQQGWTPRQRLAVGSADISYGWASLIPGDTTDFYLAFAGMRLQPPYACTVQVWTVNDTLVAGPTSFAGGRARLARTEERRHLVFRWGDTLLGSVNRGSGWETPVVVGTGLGYGAPALAADSLGLAWMSWTDSLGQVVQASYYAGSYWSSPETVALCQDGSNPQIASDEYGRIHCCWLAAGTGGLASIRWAYRLIRPGVEELSPAAGFRRKPRATIVRGCLLLPEAVGGERSAASAMLLDITGRKVMDLHPGANDIRHLSPGVYFVRYADGGARSAVQKVISQR